MKALIFGAGKIARGFIAQLLSRSGFEITFAECNENYAHLLDRAGRYYINVMGNAKESEWISGYRCLAFESMAAVSQALDEADIVFTSVVGKNLESLGKTIADAYALCAATGRHRKKAIITCENWKNPAAILKASILKELPTEELRESFEAEIGVTEAVVMRSAVEPTPEVLEIDPLAVSVHNFWRLPVDAKRFRGEKLQIQGLEYLDNFEGFLQQKVYTYNAGNATIAYLGTLKGLRLLSDAANDPEIVDMLHAAYSEINAAISTALHIPIEKQEVFAQSAIDKYQDRNIQDFTERHARDPLRKLGPEDRIVGVARLIEHCGIEPRHIAATIAAAIYYRSDNPADPSCAELVRMRTQEGVDAVLEKICHITPNERLSELVHVQIDALKQRGWIHEV